MKITEIQRASVSLFDKRGFVGTGIRDIGRCLGVNSASLYYYFNSKEDLLLQIMHESLAALLERSRLIHARIDSPLGQVSCLAAMHVGMAAVNRATSRVMDREINSLSYDSRREIAALRSKYEEYWNVSLTSIPEVDSSFDAVDRNMLRLAVLEMCNGVANWYSPAGSLTVRQIQESFVDLVGRMLGVERLSSYITVDLATPARLPFEPTD